MAELGVEEDIAFIRRTVEGGRVYARRRSADLLVWGLFVGGSYLNTYAWLNHWPSFDPRWSWLFAVVPPALYSFRRLGVRLSGRPALARSPMATALSMLWLGCGISLVTLAAGASWGGAFGYQWYDAVSASIFGIAFFAASFLCNLAWMRFIAFAWWTAEIVFFVLQGSRITPLVDAAMMLLFLAGPGLILLTSSRTEA